MDGKDELGIMRWRCEECGRFRLMGDMVLRTIPGALGGELVCRSHDQWRWARKLWQRIFGKDGGR